VEGEIVAGQFIAGMRDLSLRGKLVVDALDLLSRASPSLTSLASRKDSGKVIREWSVRK